MNYAMAHPLSHRTPASGEALYYQLGQIIAVEPEVPTGNERGSSEVLRWLGQAQHLIETVSGIVDHNRFCSMRSTMLSATAISAEVQMRHIRGLLYSALAKAEMIAPTAARGAFIPAGNTFDALTAIGGVLRDCKGFVLVVDPYLDVVALTDFLPMVPAGVPLRLLASTKQRNNGLAEAVARWEVQYGPTRPLELRFAAPRLLHDRLIIDEEKIWSLSQSFNAIAQRSPAMVQRVSPEIDTVKRAAFSDIWDNAASTT
ncbi:hypothetical protein [Polymorphobacter multimanifer]|uniref:Uncharacterized protein n=1 Tax=Polymorphobacter multimanifer TaxID=1070431 RepID=A0A841L583_9SPHN|nr:hypothetical protein [Polymorphobacter multimanifer]MBB6227787.1 hypothetical protein [Polymorphobacter multimanifer]